MKALLLILAAFGPAAFAADVRPNNAVHWVRKSAEYAALCHQTYRQAARTLRAKAAEAKSDWAVVFDLDETVLDNSKFFTQPEVADYKGRFDDSELWGPWVRRKEAGTVPGAREFIDGVRMMGPRAHIVYITNRNAAMEGDTREVLSKNGLWKNGDALLMKTGAADTKAARRECVESGKGRCAAFGALKILELFGDQITDFVEVSGPAEMAVLRSEKIPSDPDWGERYYVLPNPMYGGWEYINP